MGDCPLEQWKKWYLQVQPVTSRCVIEGAYSCYCSIGADGVYALAEAALPTERRPTMGDHVILRQGVSEGCIKGGKIGLIIEDAHDHQPYHVQCGDTKYWYFESQVQLAEETAMVAAGLVTVANAVPGLKVRRGPDWRVSV